MYIDLIHVGVLGNRTLKRISRKEILSFTMLLLLFFSFVYLKTIMSYWFLEHRCSLYKEGTFGFDSSQLLFKYFRKGTLKNFQT